MRKKARTGNRGLETENGKLLGQASLENLIMLGIGLAVATVFFYFAFTMLDDSTAAAQAKDAVSRIAQEADYVYSLAPGTARYVDFVIPRGTELIEISGRRVHMQVWLSGGLTDFYANTQAELVGVIDLNPGPARVVVKHMESGNVLVGNKELSLSPQVLEFYLERGGSGSGQINVTNGGERNLTGIAAYVLGDILDMAGIIQPAGTLAPGQNSSISVSVLIPSDKPFGTYYGSVYANSTEGSWDETAIKIVVSGGAAVSCTLSPAVANVSMGFTQDFTSTCYDAGGYGTTCPNLNWYSDGGDMIPSASPTGSTLYVNAYGTVVNAASGTFTCTASLNYPDPDGPLVTGLIYYPPSPLNATTNIMVNATGNDSTTGGSTIKMCRVNVDSGAWMDMNAVDGGYDEVAEPVTKNIGNYSSGNHTIYVQCQDYYNNWGPASSTTFFVTDTSGPGVSNIFIDPAGVCNLETATVYATATDTGGIVSMCQFRLDGGGWSNMEADDGAYDEQTELVRYYQLSGFTAGTHTLWVRCTDQYSNTGTPANQSVTIPACNPELFRNPGFDTYTGSVNNANWQFWNENRFSGGILSPDDGRTIFGTSVLMSNGEMRQGVSISGNTNYTMRVWVKSSRPLTVPLKWAVRDNSGRWLQPGGGWASSTYYFTQFVTSSWTQFSTTFVTRAGANTVTVYYRMDTPPGYVWIDDASLRMS